MKTNEVIVVFGLDRDNKPRAAKFNKADEKAARKIAVGQNFKIGRPKNDDAMAEANRLVDGKTFSSGKGLVPLVSQVTYDQLLKILDIEEPTAGSQPSAVTADAPAVADPWSSIKAGALVLCPDEGKGKERGWWEATVVAISNDVITVRWTHYPTLKPFKVKRSLIALLPLKA